MKKTAIPAPADSFLLGVSPLLACLLAVLFALLSIAAYHHAMPAVVGPVTINPVQLNKSVNRSVIASYGIYREVYTPDQKNPRFFSITVPVWRLENKEPVILRVHSQGCILDVSVNERPAHVVDKVDKRNQPCISMVTRRLDLSGWLEPGLNSVRFTIAANAAGKADLRVYTTAASWLAFTGFFLTFACILLAVLRTLRFTEPVIIIAQAGLFCCTFYYFGTDYIDVSPDITGHLGYIDYLVTNLRVPPQLRGWQLYHPPLYYIICAAACAVWDMFTPGDPYWAARFVTLLMYLGFLVFSLLIIRRWVKPGAPTLLASAMVVFWTMGTGNSSAINNDVGSWLCFIFTFWALSNWYVSRAPKDMALVISGCALAFLVKNNALLLFCIAGAVILYAERPWRHITRLARLQRLRKYLRSGVLLASVLLLLAAIGYNIGRTVYYRGTGVSGIELIIGNRPLMNEGARRQQDHLRGYYIFDYSDFIQRPFNSGMRERVNLPYFWNTFFETWLFGKDSKPLWPSREIVRTLAMLIPFLSGFIVLITGWRFIMSSTSERFRMMPWILLAALLIAGLMGSRAAIPVKSSYFVRYIYAITPVAAVLLGQGLAWLDAKGYRSAYMLGSIMTAAYILLCIILMLAKFSEMLH